MQKHSVACLDISQKGGCLCMQHALEQQDSPVCPDQLVLSHRLASL